MTVDFSALDSYELFSLAKRWTPSGLKGDTDGDAFLEAFAATIADAMNPLMAFADYAPIILNPHRCDDRDIDRILQLQGISIVPGSMSFDKMRRLAVLGTSMREWRGSFRAHRTISSALTGGPVIILPWTVLRAALDVTTLELVLLNQETESHISQIFVVGQGSGSSDYNQPELETFIDRLAKPVLDQIDVIPCFAITEWRNGINGWAPSAIDGLDLLIDSSVDNEFEALDIGPDVLTTPTTQFVRSPTTMDEPTNTDHAVHATVFMKTDSATTGDTWEIWLFGTDGGPYSSGDGYVVRVAVGYSTSSVYRVVGGTYTLINSWVTEIPDGLDPAYTRVDVIVRRTASIAAMFRVSIDGESSPWITDPGTVGSRPDGRRIWTGLTTSRFTTGRLRIAAIMSHLWESE